MSGLSIRTLLFLIVAAVVVPLTGIIVFALDKEIEARSRLAEHDVADRASDAAMQLQRQVEQGEQIALRYVTGLIGPGHDRESCEVALRELANILPIYSNMLIVDRSGSRLCSALREPPGKVPGLAEAPAFQRVIETGKPSLGTPARGLITGRWVVPQWYPRFGADGAVVGAVGLPLNLERLEKELARMTGGKGELITVLASDGTLIARSENSEQWVERKASYKAVIDAGRALDGVPFELSGIDGVTRFVAFQRLPSSGWLVYAGLDRAVALEPVSKAQRRAVFLVSIALALACAAAVWASRRIARPIVALAAATRAMGARDGTNHVPVAGPAEVAQVARELNVALDARDRAEADLRTVIDHSPEFIHLCDAQGRFLLANRALLDILGVDAAGVRGKTVRELGLPSNADRFEREFAEVMRTGRPMIGEGLSPRTDGSERFLLTNRFPVRDADGRIRAVGSIAMDVTQRRQLTDALRESEERFKTLAEFAPVGIYRADMSGAITYANRRWCEIAGLTPTEMIGNGWAKLLHPEDERRVIDGWMHFLREGGQHDVESRLVIPSGETRWILCRAALEYDAQGKAIGAVGTVTDITETKRAEQRDREHVARLEALSRRLLEVQEAERRVVARELHDEIGQALTAVNVGLQRLAKAMDGQYATQFTDMRALIDRVIGQIRDTSLSLRPVMLDDLGLVPALRWLVASIADASGLDVQFDVEPVAADLVPAVATTCFRVAQEALTNVVRHARARSVRVSLHGRGSGLVLRVEDDGVGFDPAEVQARGVVGRGFGLSAMAERLELAGGVLQVVSKPGSGTRVEMQIPVVPPESVRA